jgi:hypothetical protein
MAGPSVGINVKRLLEWIAAAIGAITCAVVPFLFVTNQQPLFPLPGLYFIEIMLLGLLVLVATAARPTRWGNLMPWVAAGVLLAFVILGGFSIGPPLIPALVTFVIVGVLADWQTGGNMALHLALFLSVAVIQAMLMLLLIMVA